MVDSSSQDGEGRTIPIVRWIDGACLTLRTVRHLRLRQLLSLLRHRASATPRLRESASRGNWDPSPSQAIGALGPVDSAGALAARMAAFGQGSVEVLGRKLPWKEAWKDLDGSAPLWRYHLHYHDLLAEAAWISLEKGDPAHASQMMCALESWIEAWGSGGTPAWDPYPVSVRLVNWLRILAWAGPSIPAPLQSRMRGLHSGHVDLLSRRIEWHLQGNHLLRNAWALVIGSHCWNGRRCLPLRARSRGLFFAELLAQIGEDGMHEERSPMYHVRALRDALEVVAVLDALGEPIPPTVRERVRAMAEVVPWLRRSDGNLFLLNDSTHDHGVDLDRVLDIATELVGASAAKPLGVRALPGARLVIVVEPQAGDRLLVDLGAPAPSHQPGHAHAGALGIELDLGDLPLLVDSGCSGYDGDPFRPYFRGTRAHNTVTIDGKDQSEMWGTFRVARRADVTMEEVRGGVDAFSIRGGCRPYHDRTGRHQRSIQRKGRGLLVEDRVVGAAGKRLDLHWHLHPDWSVAHQGASFELRHVSGKRASMKIEGPVEITIHRGETHPLLGWYARGFGQAVPTWTVRATVDANDHRILRTLIEPES